jgi:uncharacterized protein (UPF0332 family)
MDVFQDCLTKGRIKQIEPDVNLAAKELDTAREELQRARAGYVAGRWDESVTQGYFALHRCARAAIASRGYKDTNLYGLLIALEHLFIEPGLLPPATIKQIRQAKDIKDSVYDSRRATFYEARQVLQWALEMAKAIFTRLALPGFDGTEIDTTLPEAASSRPAGAHHAPRDRAEEIQPNPDRERWSPPRREGPDWRAPESMEDRTLWHPPRPTDRRSASGVRRRFHTRDAEPPLQRDSGDDQPPAEGRRSDNFNRRDS